MTPGDLFEYVFAVVAGIGVGVVVVLLLASLCGVTFGRRDGD